MRELKLLTSNDHKYEEMKQKLQGIVELNHVKMSYTELQADTTVEIARASLSMMIPLIEGDFILEDSGIEIDSLKGFPGPYSSYVFRTIGWQGVLDLMKKYPENRGARFRSVIGSYIEGDIYLFEGICEGAIGFEGKGEMGFGFDPIFIPKGYTESFAELPLDEKNKISHRGLSTLKLKDFISNL